jgi:hypothetical protein
MSHTLMGARDKAVYRWEMLAELDRNDRSRLDPKVAQVIVNHVWSDMGLLYPPKVEVDKTLNSTSAYGNRMAVTVGQQVNHVTLFHELAHSMDVSIETSAGASALRPESEVSGGSYHDDNWIGLYVNLLDRYLGGPCFNKLRLIATMEQAGLTYSLAPKPRCI